MAFSEDVYYQYSDDQGDNHPDQGGQNDKAKGGNYAAIVYYVLSVDGQTAGMGKCRANKSAHQRMRGAGRNAQPPGKQVPGDGCDQAGENDGQRDKVPGNKMGDGITDFEFPDKVFENEKSREIEDGSPQNCLEGGQHFG